MELRQYWCVVVDRFNVIAITFAVALVVAVISVFLLPQSTSAFGAAFSLAVRPQPIPETPPLNYSQDYYSYVASEYANDDLIAILQSDDFLKAVQARIQSKTGSGVDGAIDAKKAHRVITIATSSSTPDGALRLAQGIADVLTDQSAQSAYFALFTNRVETVSLIDGPRLVSQPVGRNALLNVAARSAVGLAMGIALAFLIEYLDDTIRVEDARDLFGVPVLGEIPGRALPRPRKVVRRVSTGSAMPDPDRPRVEHRGKDRDGG